MSTSIQVQGPKSTRIYTSLRSAARSLSGNGDATERTRSALRRRIAAGGGTIGNSTVKVVKTPKR